MKTGLKWKRAKIIFPTDHIISSKAREVGALGFKPQYENTKQYNMRFILSNEYMRLWFKERDLYQKENYAKQEKTRNEPNLKRGFVQRMMTNPKLESRELPIIQLKRFQNIISKVDNRRTEEEKIRICERFRKTVEPVVLSRYKPTCPNVKQANLYEKTAVKKQNKAETNSVNAKSENSKNGSNNCAFVCKLTN